MIQRDLVRLNLATCLVSSYEVCILFLSILNLLGSLAISILLIVGSWSPAYKAKRLRRLESSTTRLSEPHTRASPKSTSDCLVKKYKIENNILLYGTVTYITALLLHIVVIHI
jgi:hypothetical protein